MTLIGKDILGSPIIWVLIGKHTHTLSLIYELMRPIGFHKSELERLRVLKIWTNEN